MDQEIFAAHCLMAMSTKSAPAIAPVSQVQHLINAPPAPLDLSLKNNIDNSNTTTICKVENIAKNVLASCKPSLKQVPSYGRNFAFHTDLSAKSCSL